MASAKQQSKKYRQFVDKAAEFVSTGLSNKYSSTARLRRLESQRPAAAAQSTTDRGQWIVRTATTTSNTPKHRPSGRHIRTDRQKTQLSHFMFWRVRDKQYVREPTPFAWCFHLGTKATALNAQACTDKDINKTCVIKIFWTDRTSSIFFCGIPCGLNWNEIQNHIESKIHTHYHSSVKVVYRNKILKSQQLATYFPANEFRNRHVDKQGLTMQEYKTTCENKLETNSQQCSNMHIRKPDNLTVADYNPFRLLSELESYKTVVTARNSVKTTTNKYETPKNISYKREEKQNQAEQCKNRKRHKQNDELVDTIHPVHQTMPRNFKVSYKLMTNKTNRIQITNKASKPENSLEIEKESNEQGCYKHSAKPQKQETQLTISSLIPPIDPPPWYRQGSSGRKNNLSDSGADTSDSESNGDDNDETMKVTGLRGVQFCLKSLKSTVISFLNVNSLRNKTHELAALIRKINLSCMAFSDTRTYLKCQIPVLPGYRPFYQLKTNKRGSGGIVVYVKNSIEAFLITEPEDPTLENILWVGLKLRNIKVAVCTTYWRPTSGLPAIESRLRLDRHEIMATKIAETKNTLEQQGWATIIGGDFNAKLGRTYPGFKQNLSAEINDNGKILKDFIADNNCENFFNWRWGGGIATYFCQGTVRNQRNNQTGRQSVLDNVLWSNTLPVDFCYNSEIGSEMDIGSDHSWLTVVINDQNKTKKPDPPRFYWRLKRANWLQYQNTQENLVRQTGNQILNYDMVKNQIRNAALLTIGKRKYRERSFLADPNINQTTAQLRLCKRELKLLQNLRRHTIGPFQHTSALIQKLRLAYNLRKKLRQRKLVLSKNANRNFFENTLLRENNYKPLYKLIKNEKKRDVTLKVLKNENGQLISTREEIVRIITRFWDSIFTNIQPQMRIELQTEYPLKNIIAEKANIQLTSNFTATELKEALKMLKPGSAAGPSDIPPELLKNMSSGMQVNILNLFQQWWDSEVFPEAGQTAKVTLLHKGGDLHDIERYRTLSLNCNICKIYLRIITNRLYKICEQYSLFGEFQTGFRKNRRTTDNLLVLSTLVKKIKIEKLDGYLTFLDVKKAYDRIDRSILWKKMEMMGFAKKLIDNLKAIYSNPTANITWDISEEPIKNLQMPSGLRQGCIMSPLLFIIYMADLIKQVTDLTVGVDLEFSVNGHIYSRKINCLVFADDIVLVASSEREMGLLLQTITHEAHKSRIEFSGSKSQIIPIKKTPQKTWSLFRGATKVLEIEEHHTAKYLGVIISRKIDVFIAEKENIVSKARKVMWALYKIASNTGKSHVFGPMIWGKYALPTILYGTEAMCLSNATLIKLQTIQNRFLKMCFGVAQSTPTASVILHSGVMPIKMEYEKRLLNYFIHCSNMQWHKIIKQAVLQQKMWAYGEAIKNWYGKAREILQKIGLWTNYTHFDGTAQVWTKQHIKKRFRTLEQQTLCTKLEENPTLKHLRGETPKVVLNVRSDNESIYWLRARMAGFPFIPRRINIQQMGHDLPDNQQNATQNHPEQPQTNVPVCPLCQDGDDNLKHILLQCNVVFENVRSHLPGWSIEFQNHYKGTEVEDLFLKQMLASNKTEDEILQLGMNIKTRVSERFRVR